MSKLTCLLIPLLTCCGHVDHTISGNITVTVKVDVGMLRQLCEEAKVEDVDKCVADLAAKAMEAANAGI